MRKIIGLMILIVSLMGFSVWAEGISVELDGDAIKMDGFTGMAFLDPSGRAMVPLRVVAEKAGKTVSYDPINRIAMITDDKNSIAVPIDKDYVIINQESKPNDAPARIFNSRTYLPIRIVMEALGYQVEWDGSLSKVIITSKPVVEEPAASVPNTIGNTNINLYNGGLMASENENLVFVNFADEERIWRIDQKTGVSNRISERNARGINVVDGWVYYRQETPYGIWELFKTRIDGTGTTMEATGNVEWLKVDSGYLYYYLSNEEALYRKKLTDPSATKYYEKTMTSINLENGWLVYVKMEDNRPGDIIKVDIASRVEKTLSTEQSGISDPFVTLIGDTIYFTRYNDALSLYAMDLKNGEIKKINDRWTYNVTGNGQNLYSLYPEFDDGLYKLDVEGKTEIELSSGWRPGRYYDPGLTLIDSNVYYLDLVSTNRYRWLGYDLQTGVLKSISIPEDLMK